MALELSQREIYHFGLINYGNDGLRENKRVQVLIAHLQDWIDVAAFGGPDNNPLIVDITTDDDDPAVITVLISEIKAVKVG